MVFVIGGKQQGKKEYVLDRYRFTEADICYGEDLSKLILADKGDMNQLEDIKCLIGLHQLVRELFTAYYNESYIQEEIEEKIRSKIDAIIEKNTIQVIISNEEGYGIVPMDKRERFYRDCVGRISQQIAKRADHVIRVVAGLPQVLK